MITKTTVDNAKVFLTNANGDVLRATKEIGKQYQRGVLTMTEKNDMIEVLSGYLIFGWM